MAALIRSVRLLATAVAVLAVVGTASADYYRQYEVSITNLTKAQAFTPQLVATHDRHVSYFQVGEEASQAVADLAEGGATGGVEELLAGFGYRVADVQVNGALLDPGATATITVKATRYHRHLSLGAMLIPTNDTFVALNGVRLPRWGTATYTALAYDAGTEFNDQNCDNIPGPVCGGTPFSDAADNDEGFIYVSNGFHDLPAVEGSRILGPFNYDWRNPVAQIRVRRIQ